jgi:hypothetical protein
MEVPHMVMITAIGRMGIKGSVTHTLACNYWMSDVHVRLLMLDGRSARHHGMVMTVVAGRMGIDWRLTALLTEAGSCHTNELVVVVQP